MKKIELDELEEMGICRCPFCNINDVSHIDVDEWSEQWAEGFRYYCACCEKCYFEPVIDVSDVLKLLSKKSPVNKQNTKE